MAEVLEDILGFDLPTEGVSLGDCIEVMRTLPENSVDSIVTDPPYGLGFMGKKWDELPPGEEWARECLRVLKPGGHMIAFGGSRTWHRLAVAIEDAGFEIRDGVLWLYGSGFPKSHDISKAIDKLDAVAERRERALEFTRFIRESGLTSSQIDQITGTNMGGHFTTAASQPAIATADLFDLLRPHLPEIPARIEALVEQRTVESQNYANRRVLTTETRFNEPSGIVGVGQGVRTEVVRKITDPHTPEAEQWQGWGTALKPAYEPAVMARKPFPGSVAGNVLEHGTGALNIDASRIETSDKLGGSTSLQRVSRGAYGYRKNVFTAQGEASQVSGRFPANLILDPHTSERLDQQADASKFFYVAKAPKSERPVVDGVAHPTVKPLTLMRYLVRMVTPPGGLVLDPFAGSGTTAEAALLEGFRFHVIERGEEYLPLIHARIERATKSQIEALI